MYLCEVLRNLPLIFDKLVDIKKLLYYTKIFIGFYLLNLFRYRIYCISSNLYLTTKLMPIKKTTVVK